LETLWCDLPGPDSYDSDDDADECEAAPLLQLTALTKLGVGGSFWNDEAMLTVLMHLTGE
jgi:hypothetical protein